MRRIGWIILAWWMLGLNANAGTVESSGPHGKQQFNITCPAKQLQPELDAAYHDCSNDLGGSVKCERFVEIYRKLLPKYDCQYTDDNGIDWHVPALFMARSPGAVEDYTRLLWRLSSLKDKKFSDNQFQNAVLEARNLFGSK